MCWWLMCSSGVPSSFNYRTVFGALSFVPVWNLGPKRVNDPPEEHPWVTLFIII